LAVCLFVGIAAVLLFQRQSLHRLRQENLLFQQQVERLTAYADHLAAETGRLSALNEVQLAKAGTPLTQEQFSELLRLRGQVGRLQILDQDAERLHRDQMQAAQAKLSNAEAELARVKKLHAQNLVSAAEFSESKFALELLQAQARGDTAEADRIRRRHAEEELARAAELRSRSLISESEYNEALIKVALHKADSQP
jgi:hypothetical protein